MTGPRKLDLPDSTPAAQPDGRRSAPSAERNAEAILRVLKDCAPKEGRALEIASGTGQHIARFAAEFPALDWFPTEADPRRFPSIEAWRRHAGCANLHPPIPLDATALPWPADLRGCAVIVLVNLLHLISSDEADRLLCGVASALDPGGCFLLYGPFRRDGKLTSAGDMAFDAQLQAQDAAIGYKDDGWVRARAAARGLALVQAEEMPANNLAFVFGKAAGRSHSGIGMG